MEPELSSPSLSFGPAVEESEVVTVARERESKRRRKRHVRRVTHRAGTIPLPPLSPEFLVAVVVHAEACPEKTSYCAISFILTPNLPIAEFC
ncbi:hypothetical protein AHAS_Ahas19G0240500 [Arachis hypogaea]